MDRRRENLGRENCKNEKFLEQPQKKQQNDQKLGEWEIEEKKVKNFKTS